jgi:hypothetical protein
MTRILLKSLKELQEIFFIKINRNLVHDLEIKGVVASGNTYY